MPKLLHSDRWKYVVSDLNILRSTKSDFQYFNLDEIVEITTVRTLVACNFDLKKKKKNCEDKQILL